MPPEASHHTLPPAHALGVGPRSLSSHRFLGPAGCDVGEDSWGAVADREQALRNVLDDCRALVRRTRIVHTVRPWSAAEVAGGCSPQLSAAVAAMDESRERLELAMASLRAAQLSEESVARPEELDGGSAGNASPASSCSTPTGAGRRRSLLKYATSAKEGLGLITSIAETKVANIFAKYTYDDAKEEMSRRIWDAAQDAQEIDFFQDVLISSDGGLSEVHELWYPMRWIGALTVMVWLVSNIYVISICNWGNIFGAQWSFGDGADGVIVTRAANGTDSAVAQEEEDTRMKLLLSRWLLEWLLNAVLWPFGIHGYLSSTGISMICALEMLILMLLLLRILCGCAVIAFARDERKRWLAVASLFWTSIPEVCTYSAMRLLHFVTPAVLVADIYKFYTYSQTRWATATTMGRPELLIASKWVKLIVTRTLCLVIGVDAFLIKILEAWECTVGRYRLSAYGFWALLIFIMQILGIVQLQTFVRQRIFKFIFGGEDGILQAEERALQNVWEATLAQKTWQVYPWPKAVAMLMTYDDFDFQKLVLNTRPGDPQDVVTSVAFSEVRTVPSSDSEPSSDSDSMSR